MAHRVSDYFETLAALPMQSEVTDANGRSLAINDFFEAMTRDLPALAGSGNKLMIIGNGGSASIASHIALDFSKHVGVATLAFNDPVFLTALSNDIGYDQVFAKQVEFYANPGDMLLAVSSSGNSESITNAVIAARVWGCKAVTMSGFAPDNKLRSLGDYNLYVPSSEYGFVEVTHLSLCHSLVDLTMGWSKEDGLWSARAAGQGAA